MKKIVLTMVALLSMTVAVAGQSDNKGERKSHKKPTPEEMTARMAKELDLSDAQKEQVLQLNKEYEKVLGNPRMARGPRGPRPDGVTGATPQQDGDNGEKTQKSERPKRPELTDAQKAEMKQHMEQRKEYNEKLKKVLSDEQFKKYQEQHRRGHGRGGHGHGGHGRGHGPGAGGPRPNWHTSD